MGWRAMAVAALAAFAAAGLACGDRERQDADEPPGAYRLDVTRARFPASQSIAEAATMAIEVRNADSRAAPNVAVTIETDPGRRRSSALIAFGQKVSDPALADAGRPIWVVDRGPRGGDTAYVNTWALGRLEPGDTARFEWRVTAVRAGAYRIAYRVAPGLDRRARLARGSRRASGSFTVRIADTPRAARVTADGDFVAD